MAVSSQVVIARDQLFASSGHNPHVNLAKINDGFLCLDQEQFAAEDSPLQVEDDRGGLIWLDSYTKEEYQMLGQRYSQDHIHFMSKVIESSLDGFKWCYANRSTKEKPNPEQINELTPESEEWFKFWREMEVGGLGSRYITGGAKQEVIFRKGRKDGQKPSSVENPAVWYAIVKTYNIPTNGLDFRKHGVIPGVFETVFEFDPAEQDARLVSMTLPHDRCAAFLGAGNDEEGDDPRKTVTLENIQTMSQAIIEDRVAEAQAQPEDPLSKTLVQAGQLAKAISQDEALPPEAKMAAQKAFVSTMNALDRELVSTEHIKAFTAEINECVNSIQELRLSAERAYQGEQDALNQHQHQHHHRQQLLLLASALSTLLVFTTATLLLVASVAVAISTGGLTSPLLLATIPLFIGLFMASIVMAGQLAHRYENNKNSFVIASLEPKTKLTLMATQLNSAIEEMLKKFKGQITVIQTNDSGAGNTLSPTPLSTPFKQKNRALVDDGQGRAVISRRDTCEQVLGTESLTPAPAATFGLS